MFKYYLEIVKPGIIIGNIILIIGGYFLASHIFFDLFLFFFTILGTSLVIASSCVFNNLIDFDIDQKMNRTKNRVLSKKLLNFRSVTIFGITLGILGISILGFLVNHTSMFLSIFACLIYVIFYTLLYKRTSIYSTFIGSLSGSMPSVIGYTAVSNTIDLCSVLLFIIFILWQMSHFYSISIIRLKDYQNAKIPVFSVVKGVVMTKKHIFYYIIFFIIFSSTLTFLGYVSYFFFFVSSIVNFYWLFLSFQNIYEVSNVKYSLNLFYFSIIVVFLFNFLILIDFIFFKHDVFINILQV